MTAPVRIRVPATTANLGAGYDLIGLALNIYNEFTFSSQDEFQLELAGPRAKECSFALDQNSLVWRAFARVYQYCGEHPPVFKLEQQVAVPPARGLGSSSTAIVAGLLAANHWLGNPLEAETLFLLATELEGHPDNVAPALFGGCVINFSEPQAWRHLPIPENIFWGVCIPSFELSTASARAVLPTQVPHRDAVLNASYLAGLVTALFTDDIPLLTQSLRDKLHQDYRAPLVPGMSAVMQAATEAGALACVLSGAGPTLLTLWQEKENDISAAMLKTWGKFGIQAEFVTCLIDRKGAICLD